MRLKKLNVKNFGSYKQLTFDFEDKGLSLLYGATGSGKSTFEDIPCWIITGKTAKDGNVDDIRPWNDEGPTEGVLGVSTPSGDIEITRIRGKGCNNLFWTELNSNTKVIGKDLIDTQILLEKRLNITTQSYFLGSYFTEFSRASSLFTAKSAERKEFFESIADLSFPTNLQDALGDKRKELRKELGDKKILHSRIMSKIESYIEQLKSLEDSYLKFEINKQSQLKELTVKRDNFDIEKYSKIEALKTKGDRLKLDKYNRIKKLQLEKQKLFKAIKNHEYTKCTQCGSVGAEAQEAIIHNEKIMSRISMLDSTIEELEGDEDPYLSFIAEAEALENHYQVQIDEKAKEVNPFDEQKAKCNDFITIALRKESAVIETLSILEATDDKLDKLQELSVIMKSVLLQNTISEVETSTNEILSNILDSPFRIQLTILDNNLDLTIIKDGVECNYKQLSKGQRGMLKLSFGASIMKSVSNNSGCSFYTLFFDEALDGLDNELKVKAFTLFEVLAKNTTSVFVVEHSPEFKEMFSNVINVSLQNGFSELEYEECQDYQ